MAHITKNSDPVRPWAKRITKTSEQHAHMKQVKSDHNVAFNTAIQDAHTIIGELIDKISLEFNYNTEYVAEKLHLGGHTLRQRRSAAINNAYVHCMAMCEKECAYFNCPLHDHLLTQMQGLMTNPRLISKLLSVKAGPTTAIAAYLRRNNMSLSKLCKTTATKYNLQRHTGHPFSFMMSV